MERLIVVSNRVALPGKQATQSGGLAMAMNDALQNAGGLWFGWSGAIDDAGAMQPRTTTSGNVSYMTVDLSEADYADYYVGFANSTLWPLVHYRLDLIEFSNSAFDGYLRVNRRLAQVLRPHIRPDDVIWVHDYHLIPFARELRRMGVVNRIGFFLHTPFPAPEVLVAAPPYMRLLEALCAYDLVGFQTSDDLHAFQEAVVREARGTARPDGMVRAFGRSTRADVFPIGIDTREFAAMAKAAAGSAESRRLVESVNGKSLILGVDRLDYSKGLPHRMRGFEQVLTNHPELRGKVVFMQIAPPSRSDVKQYRRLRKELEAEAGRINTRFSEFDWAPVRCLTRNVPRRTIAGFFRASRIALVTPLRDGMNLVAKEFVASQNPVDPGVLVLSRFAGAAHELSEGALVVNPFDPDDIAQAIHRGLAMGLDERRARWQAMMSVLEMNTIGRWRDSFLLALKKVGGGKAAMPVESNLPLVAGRSLPGEGYVHAM